MFFFLSKNLFYIFSKETSKNENFKILIADSTTNRKHEYFYSNKNPNELIMTVMNKICFDSQRKGTLDGNFISVYDEKDNRFHYFVHRLKGLKFIKDQRKISKKE